MTPFETVLYYFALTLFIVANTFFWGLLLHIALKAIYDKAMSYFK
jgi:hypothetical protein